MNIVKVIKFNGWLLSFLATTLACSGNSFDKRIDLEVKVLGRGAAVANARVKGGFKRRFGGDKPVVLHVPTNSDGISQFSAISSGQIAVEVVDAEYYTHYESIDLYDSVKKGPIATNLVIKLKEKINPTPMYVKEVGEFVPEDGKPIGYDMVVGDWVSPYGKGQQSDIVFTTKFSSKDSKNFTVVFDVFFPSELNGIQPMHSGYDEGEGSLLISDHEAPLDGYKPQISCTGGRRDGAYSFQLPHAYNVAGYYFRIRTKLDENGNIKSAMYGKIYGAFKYGRRFDTKTNFTFNYYLNPDETRNMEFDPDKNLFLKGHKGRVPSCYSLRTP